MAKKRLSILAGVLAAAALLTACGGPSQTGNTDDGGSQATLTIGTDTPPVRLDPSTSANGDKNRWFIDSAYASLLTLDKDANIAPGLASAWTVSDDNTSIDFTLRPDLKFADGTPLGAEEVVKSLEYFQKGQGPTVPYQGNLSYEVVSPTEVKVTSTVPEPLLALLFTPKYMAGDIISPAGLADPEKLAGDTFGAGQYKLDSAQSLSEDHYTYVRNDNYYDQDAITFDSITIKVIPNATSLVQALKTGQVDVVTADSSVVDGVKGASGISMVKNPANWNGLYLVDRGGDLSPALANEKVRQALNYAVDRKSITQAVYGDYGQPTDQPIVPGPLSGFSDSLTDHYTYDPQKAKDLLAEAGYGNGFEFKALYKAYEPDSTKMVQAIAGQLADLGITMDLQGVPTMGEWVSALKSKQFAAAQHAAGSRPLYLEVQFGYLPKAVMNVFDVPVPEISAAVDKFQTAPAGAAEDAAKDIMKAVVEQAVALPIATTDAIYLHSDKIQGIEFLGNGPELSPVTSWSAK